MRYLLLSIASLLILSCANNSNSGTTNETIDLAGFTTIDLGGSGEQQKKYDENNNLLEEGYMVNGKKNGAWITYYDSESDKRIKTLKHYTNNQLNGPSYEFNKRGQIEKESNYTKGVLDGLLANYKFGRAEITTEYKNGSINGFHREYFQNGKIQKEIEFKNNKKDGSLKYYDEEGNVTLSYEYKNDEKISGGIVE